MQPALVQPVLLLCRVSSTSGRSKLGVLERDKAPRPRSGQKVQRPNEAEILSGIGVGSGPGFQPGVPARAGPRTCESRARWGQLSRSPPGDPPAATANYTRRRRPARRSCSGTAGCVRTCCQSHDGGMYKKERPKLSVTALLYGSGAALPSPWGAPPLAAGKRDFSGPGPARLRFRAHGPVVGVCSALGRLERQPVQWSGRVQQPGAAVVPAWRRRRRLQRPLGERDDPRGALGPSRLTRSPAGWRELAVPAQPSPERLQTSLLHLRGPSLWEALWRL